MTIKQSLAGCPSRPTRAGSAGAGLAALAWLCAAGCQPTIAAAPFRARPDSVLAGDLKGPFDGRVIDGGSGKPVEGAAVVGSWSLRAGAGPSGPAGARVVSVDTDADGRYRIGPLKGGVDAAALVERFTLVIYKRGYLGWRSDVRFADRSPQTEFTQLGNVARLVRLPADVSHARHLAYVGAAGPLLPRVEWELPLAAEELAPSAEAVPAAAAGGAGPAPTRAPAAEAAPHLDGRVLLSADELAAVSGERGGFAVEALPDVPSSPSYDSVHFRSLQKGERFDAAIRVWKLPSVAAAQQRFEQLAAELPQARPGTGVGDGSVRAAEGDILALAALDRGRGVVLQFSCGRGLCADHQQVAALVRRMWGRLPRLGQTRRPAEGSEPRGTEGGSSHGGR